MAEHKKETACLGTMQDREQENFKTIGRELEEEEENGWMT